MTPHNATDYLVAECPLWKENVNYFLSVHLHAMGQVCDTGCRFFNSGNCPAYRKLTERDEQDKRAALT